MTWNPCLLAIGDKDLLHHFRFEASQSLTTFGQDPKELGKVLVRVAVVGNSPSACAVLQSLLALASLHRYGVQEQALQLKIASLRALAAASASEDLGPMEVIQHVATGMLLCSFEVHQASCTSSQWTWYISGVKKVLNAASSKKFRTDSGDLSTLMDWVYYHDVLARFTLRHWKHDPTSLTLNATNDWTEVCTQVTVDRIFHASSHTLTTLELLSEVCDTVAAKPHETMTMQDLDDYRGFLRVLDWRIRSISSSNRGKEDCEADTIVELYQLAILVYLNRVSGNLLDQSVRTQQYLDRAYEMFETLDSCERQFPIFILGCEARTDEHRKIILDLIARTGKRSSSRSLNHVKILILAIWAQDDLADREINYWDKMTGIISRCSILPSLV